MYSKFTYQEYFLKNNAQLQVSKIKKLWVFEFWASKRMKYLFSYTKMKQQNPIKTFKI